MSSSHEYPVKKMEMENHHMDSTLWNDFKFRPDDIIIGSYGKSGTTWTQQIVAQLAWGTATNHAVAERSPWLDLRFPPKEVKFQMLEAQTQRRIVKTHLPVQALVFKPEVKYIYIARDGRDAFMSWFNHHQKANDLFYQAVNGTPGLVGPPLPKPISDDPREYFLHWIEKNGDPLWPFWENVKSWWDIRDLPNVLLLHFNDLKQDLPGQILRVARFLGVELQPGSEELASVVERCSFEWMKTHGELVVPTAGAIWEGGPDTFLHKGTNGRWRDIFTPEDSQLYEKLTLEHLGMDCAAWLASGSCATPSKPTENSTAKVA